MPPAMTQRESDRLQALAKEVLRRKNDALRLFKPLAKQREFLNSQAFFRIARGGNRAGKTSVTAYEVARCVRGEHPYYGRHRPLRIYVIVDREDHIGRVIHRSLFQWGAFRIIKDLLTDEWRAFDPVADAGREKESKPSPPFIPPEMIETTAWYNKGMRSFQVVRMHKLDPSWDRGTEIYAFSSRASEAQGDPIDLGWIDEDLTERSSSEIVDELTARTFDYKGRIIWSAKPHNDCDALTTASEKASQQIGQAKPTHEEVVLTTLDNKYLDQEAIAERSSGLSADAYRARILGEFSTDSVLMYPMFHKNTHQIPRDWSKERIDDLVQQGIPANWTRYIGIDPGFTTAFALFAAVTPPELGDFVVVYDELQMHQCTADKLAKSLSEKGEGQNFEAFIIDEHGSRVTEAGSGLTIKHQYSLAFKKWNLWANSTGHGFISGCDDRAGRASLVRSYFSIAAGTTCPRLLLLKNACPALIESLGRYKKWKKGDVMQDVADPKSAYSHGPNALEYLIAANLKYVRPKRAAKKHSPAYAEFLADRERERRGKSGFISLGPAGR